MMTTGAMFDAMATKGDCPSPGGQTPHVSLYATILRAIQ